MQQTPPPYRGDLTEPPTGDLRSSRRTSAAQRWLIVAFAVASGAVAAVVSDARPAMWTPADVVWRAFVVAGIALCASRARRWTLIWLAVPAALFGDGWLRIFGVAALVGAIIVTARDRRDRPTCTAVGGLGAIGLLSLSWPGGGAPTGTTALIAVLAVAPLLVSAFGHARTREKRIAMALFGAVALVMVLGVGAIAAFGVTNATSVRAAVDDTQRAVDGADDDDAAAVQQRFDTAAASFADLAVASDQWWYVPARSIPIIGPNFNLARTALAAGADLNQTAATLSTSVDQQQLRRPDGGIDLAVLASLESPAQSGATTIAGARADLDAAASPWILPPVRVELGRIDDQLASAEQSAETVALASQAAPTLLGADGPRRYLLLLGNPAELRDVGGHIGNWAELVADNGRLDVVEVGSPYELFNPQTNPPPTLTSEYPTSLLELRPQYFSQNWGGTPDTSIVARLAAELYPQARPGAPIDGVIYADPEAFAAILSITGGVEVPATDVELTSRNAVQFLTVDQFSELADAAPGTDPLGDTIETVLEKFTRQQLPGPRRLADLFSPVVAGGHLQISTFDPATNELLDRLGLRRTLDRPNSTDVLSVINRNANPSKIDAFLRREVAYAVRWDPVTGRTLGTVSVRLTNTAPAGGVAPVVVNPPPGAPAGTNRTQLSILSPLDATRATIDGATTGIGTTNETATVRRHAIWLDLAPGQTSEVVVDLDGAVSPGSYELHWIGQPVLDPGPTEISISPLDSPNPDRAAVREVFPGDENRIIRYEPTPST